MITSTFQTETLPEKCKNGEEWINKLAYIYTIEYHSPIKSNNLVICGSTWMNLKHFLPCEHTVWFHLCKVLEQAMLTQSKRNRNRGCRACGLLLGRGTKKLISVDVKSTSFKNKKQKNFASFFKRVKKVKNCSRSPSPARTIPIITGMSVTWDWGQTHNFTDMQMALI